MAGFEDLDVWLEPAAVVLELAEDYLRTVCLGPHLERLLGADRFVRRGGALRQPVTLDSRLNICARRPPRMPRA